MNSSIVVDASFVSSLVLYRQESRVARALWSQWRAEHLRCSAPSLLLLEVGTSIRKYVYTNQITEEAATTSLMAFQLLLEHISIAPLSQLFEGAWDLARRYKLINLYDASYVALADQLGCEVWTLDAKMKRAMPGHAEKIKLISAGA